MVARNSARPSLFLSAALLTALLGCTSGPDPVDTQVLTARTDTACAPAGEPLKLGEASSAFACRGDLLLVNGRVVGVARAAKDSPLTIFDATDPAATPPQTTTHTGARFAFIPAPNGFLLVSAEEEGVQVTLWGLDLRPSGEPRTSAPTTSQEPLAFALTPLSVGATGVLAAVALATSEGVDLWLIGADGTVTGPTHPIAFTDTPYCNTLELRADGDNLRLALGCQDVQPAEPRVAEGVATIAEFAYEGDLPPQSNIVATVDLTGKVTGAEVVPGQLTPATSGYALLQYLKEQTPRAAGERVNVLDAIAVGDKDVLALTCVGADQGAVELRAARLTCQSLPAEN